jgi:hypothetical protein
VEVDGSVDAGDELLDGVGMVVMGVRAHDADHAPAGYGAEDGGGVMGGIDDEDLLIVTD